MVDLDMLPAKLLGLPQTSLFIDCGLYIVDTYI